MEYYEAANKLLDLRRYSARPGTAATTALLSRLGDPHEAVPAIQIAGSNGKGSTARLLESTLSTAGLDVGLYISPHLDDPRDRIRVNERRISKSAVVEFVEEVDEYLTASAANGDSPTFFETMTALALWEFGRQEVDVAVVEVGIGGSLDATSAVDPVASAVTTVAREHTGVLGDDIEEIARDMAGIEPADGPLVTSATGDAFDAMAATTAETIGVDVADDSARRVSARYEGRDGIEGKVRVETPDWEVETALPLLGAHQARNAGVAAGVLWDLVDRGVLDPFEPATVARGFRNAHWPGRFEVMNQEPLVVLDGAHNPDGCRAASETLEEFEYDRLHVVAGIMADKDLRAMASALAGADHVTACRPEQSRAEDETVVARVFEEETAATVETCRDVEGALRERLSAADEGDCVLVTGSLYTVGEARGHWTRTQVPKRANSSADATRILEDAGVPEHGIERARGDAVHHVVETRARPRQARTLRDAMLAAGGECAISGLAERTGENRAVVLMGTATQFEGLRDELDETSVGLAAVAEDITAGLGVDSGDDETEYPWEEGTAVMGILNVTPDSFHDGGEYNEVEAARERATEMVETGVDIVDIGGESTRPGADPVPVDEEIGRVRPVIEALADLDVLVSIDTRKAPVARAALDAGADILNDVSGLEDPAMRLVAAEYDVPVVVMHSVDAPVDPENDVHYDDVVGDVIDGLTERVLLAEKAGLDRSQIIVDPGLGFGKTAAESFELLGRVEEFTGLGCPVLVGHSHKSMFGHVGRESGDRYEATVAATAFAAERGADIVRVHDVDANVAAVDVVEAANRGSSPEEE